LNDALQPKSKRNLCRSCESVRDTRHSDSPDFLRDYAVNPRAVSQQLPPPPSTPLPYRIDEDVLGTDGFRGYDSPRGDPSGNTGGSGGNLPPDSGNAGGGRNPSVSNSSLPNPLKYLGRSKSH